MQSGTYCTPECPFTHDDGFVGQEKKIPVAVVADIVRVLCSSAHESLMALFRKHLFVPTIASTCVIYTTKEPGVGLSGLEQRLSASQHTDKKNIIFEIIVLDTVLTKQREVSRMLYSRLHPSNTFHQGKCTKESICLCGLLSNKLLCLCICVNIIGNS